MGGLLSTLIRLDLNVDFKTVANKFKADRIRELSLTNDGMRFLKLRSLSRKDQMQYLVNKYHIDVGQSNSRSWLQLIYESELQIDAIDAAISALYEQERSGRRDIEDQLINELYKVDSFNWGGLHQNSLEKTIVDNFIKKITSYAALSNAIENDILNKMRAYVLTSWYNHWSSIIIEDIFKDHPKVIPAIGLIKKIDFFVNDKPFDLKVTYLPEGYIKDWRKLNNLRPELTLMKQMCTELHICFDKHSPDSVLIPDLWQKLDDHPNQGAYDLISELQGYRESLLQEAVDNPELLIRWLYENQGVRRFDAANRLFLILVDKGCFFDSWKLKRAKPFVSENVNAHLNSMDSDIGFQLDFNWRGEVFTAESDIIFVVKE